MKKKIMILSDLFKERDLSLKESVQLPFMKAGCIALMILFSLLCILTLFGTVPVISIFTAFMASIYGLSLFLFSKRRVFLVSNIISFSLALLGFILIAFGTSQSNNPFIVYRNAIFITAMSSCNQALSVREKQDKYFTLYILLLWVIGTPFAVKNAYLNDPKTTINASVTATFALMLIMAMTISHNGFVIKLVKSITEQSDKAEKSYNKVKAAVEESKEGMEIGQKLKDLSSDTKSSISTVDDLFDFLNESAKDLSDQTKAISDENGSIIKASIDMKSSIEDQNIATSNTSAALNQISANLTSLSNITSSRKEGLNNIVMSVQSQSKLLEDLSQKIIAVEESCKQISNLVKTVNDISSQTNILAMNASIEAAHAGNAGLGFSVIAQEIRKLSEETSKNADQIAKVLKTNRLLVKDATSSTEEFKKYNAESVEEITSTVNSIDEIISGIAEVDLGTKEIMNSLNEIVSTSQDTNKLVLSVTNSLDNQSNSVLKINRFSDNLGTKVKELENAIDIIKTNIDEIIRQSDKNIQTVEKFNSNLL